MMHRPKVAKNEFHKSAIVTEMASPPKKATPGVVSQIGRAVFGIILLLPMVVVALLCLVLRGLSHRNLCISQRVS